MPAPLTRPAAEAPPQRLLRLARARVRRMQARANSADALRRELNCLLREAATTQRRIAELQTLLPHLPH